MRDTDSSWLSKEFGDRRMFFRPISPEAYANFGIDPQDIPMGTFAAEDHPSFLPSRYGGNAYGLGLIEQSALNRADTDFLEDLNFQDPEELARHARRLNTIYQKLGLLIRFSLTGKLYFLIPINLVAHSLQDIKEMADEVEELTARHSLETGKERLDVGLMTAGHDLTAHELTARLSNHRIFLFESIDKIRSWRIALDIIILPKDIFEYLLEQKFSGGPHQPFTRRRILSHAMYLVGKICDALGPGGKFIMPARSHYPQGDKICRVRFRSEEELKSFLLFTHVYKTGRRYTAQDMVHGDVLEISLPDIFYYMERLPYSEPHLKRILGHKEIEHLSVEDINGLPYLNVKLPRPYVRNTQKQWERVCGTCFETVHFACKSSRHSRDYWENRLEMEEGIPETLWIYVGKVREPVVTLASLEEDVKASGMMGCSLPLVAEYRNSFRYVLDVLRNVIRIRDGNFPTLTELGRMRLSNPFVTKSERFAPVLRLLNQISKLEKVHDYLNPDHIEGHATPILENIARLSLHGFTPEQLREILLIVVGHTTMSRIAFGKLPARTLKPITDNAREDNYQEIVTLLRICRLMSIAQIAAALGDSFTAGQAGEVFLLYDDAIQVATDPQLDWEQLSDLRISALGGIQYKAVREMLKFFNLFEFIDNWRECRNKGKFQKEVHCDYDPRLLARMEEAVDLADIADQFKCRLASSCVFDRSYFFRHFLDMEFHGTGHLFPKLGTRAGFMLLWLAVNSAGRRIVNFNPLLAQTPHDRYEERVGKIREVLSRIPVHRLVTGFFDGIKKSLAEGYPAFIFESGIRLMVNPKTRAVDVSFVDVKENIRQIDSLLTHLESRRLQGVSLRNLQNMERLFSELESFHQYLRQAAGGPALQDGAPDGAKGMGIADAQAVNGEIGQIEERLKSLFQGQVFIPEEVYDTMSVLAANCPEILRFILPEFHDFGNLIEEWPTRERVSLGVYIMRCLQKFQALVTRNRNAFQDRNTFYQLAKQEFGSLAEEGIGPGHAQTEILEHLVGRIQQRPLLYRALTLALFFQDVGKVERFVEGFTTSSLYACHAGLGAALLSESQILDWYDRDAQLQSQVVLLIRHHGAIGHVIQGEEPETVLDHLTAVQDARLLDVFVLHAILAAASVQDDLMISDLLDLFLSYRAAALQVIKSHGNWRMHVEDELREKGQAVAVDPTFTPEQLKRCLPDHDFLSGVAERGMMKDDALWRGRFIGSLERLLRLMGATWIDFQDLQMYLLKIPVTFIYHKKRLKSVGPATFEKQLSHASRILDALTSFDEDACFYFLYCLDHLGAGMRVYDFDPFSRFLEAADCLKLLFASFRAFHAYFGEEAAGGSICFRRLGQTIDRRHMVLRQVIEDLPAPHGSLGGKGGTAFTHSLGELRFDAREAPDGGIVHVVFEDGVHIESMVRSLVSLRSHGELTIRYEALLAELDNLPFDARDYKQILRQAYEQQEKKINELTIKVFKERLNHASNFCELQDLHEEMKHMETGARFSEDQKLLMKDIFEYHRARIRDSYLDHISQRIEAIESADQLSEYWDNIKCQLFNCRHFVGKEYESLVAEFMEQKLAGMEEN